METERRLEEAMRGSWERLHNQLLSMSEKLVEVEGEDKRRWYDSFLTNPQELCDMLTHLNVTNDPELEKARRDLEVALMGADIDVLKDSEHMRATVKTKVDNIIKQYEW
jgi:hypothetical protein